jgi:hypothetical protein
MKFLNFKPECYNDISLITFKTSHCGFGIMMLSGPDNFIPVVTFKLPRSSCQGSFCSASPRFDMNRLRSQTLEYQEKY